MIKPSSIRIATRLLDFPVEPDDQSRTAVDLHRFDRHPGADPGQADSQEAGHPDGPHDRTHRGPLDPAAVSQQDDVRREHVEQALQVTRFDRPLECLERAAGLGCGHGPARPPRRDVGAGPVRDLADRSRALADSFGDLVVLQTEHLAQHEHCPLGRRERLQHQQHRHRHALGQFDVLGHVGRGEQRLGQPGADVGLLAPAERAQPGQRLAGGDPDQVGTLIPHGAEIDARPPQPGLLQDVLGVGGRAEHLVGDGEQQVAVGDERLGGGVRAAVSEQAARLLRAGSLCSPIAGSCPFASTVPHAQDAGPAPLCDTRGRCPRGVPQRHRNRVAGISMFARTPRERPARHATPRVRTTSWNPVSTCSATRSAPRSPSGSTTSAW